MESTLLNFIGGLDSKRRAEVSTLNANSPHTFTNSATPKWFCRAAHLRKSLKTPAEFCLEAKKHSSQMTHESKSTESWRRWLTVGERLLAFGYHRLPAEFKQGKSWSGDIVFVGIIGFIDPPRKEVRGAIKTCQEAGIKVIMITGDHPETARTIASPSRHKQR